MIFREFTYNDKGDVLSILKEVWEIDDIDDIVLEDFANNDNLLYVVETNGQVVGCITLHLQKKLIRNGGIAAILEEVVVKEEHRGKEIGKFMVTNAVEEAKKLGCYKVVLSCYPNRVFFYERCGFINETITMRYNLK